MTSSFVGSRKVLYRMRGSHHFSGSGKGMMPIMMAQDRIMMGLMLPIVMTLRRRPTWMLINLRG
jgi:hypothetical protein